MQKGKAAPSKKQSNVITKHLGLISETHFILGALSNPLRQKVLSYLSSNKQASVTELIQKCRATDQSIMSQHLAILRKANLVRTERDGRTIYYSVNKENLKEVLALAKGLAAL